MGTHKNMGIIMQLNWCLPYMEHITNSVKVSPTTQKHTSVLKRFYETQYIDEINPVNYSGETNSIIPLYVAFAFFLTKPLLPSYSI